MTTINVNTQNTTETAIVLADSINDCEEVCDLIMALVPTLEDRKDSSIKEDIEYLTKQLQRYKTTKEDTWN